MTPPNNATTTQSAHATSGILHEPVRMLYKNSAATSNAISMSNITAGSCALSTEYSAPCT
ncbi:unannotated protein [freshwater metagenome]|uniref:Unannotated protein n=1 Tax=freshwater metagenome TaxID=449393 RepID=A0A6J6Q8N1_9ZZZZ